MITSRCFWGFSRAIFEDLLLFRISLVVHNIILFRLGLGVDHKDYRLEFDFVDIESAFEDRFIVLFVLYGSTLYVDHFRTPSLFYFSVLLFNCDLEMSRVNYKLYFHLVSCKG